MWNIKKNLFRLSSIDIHKVAEDLAGDREEDKVKLSQSDEEGCTDIVVSYMQSEKLLESDDEGMANLLMLNDVVNRVIFSVEAPIDESCDGDVHANPCLSTMSPQQITHLGEEHLHRERASGRQSSLQSNPERGGTTRTLHRNVLLQVNDLPVDLPEETVTTKKLKSKLRNRRLPHESTEPTQRPDTSDSEGEDGVPCYWLRIPEREQRHTNLPIHLPNQHQQSGTHSREETHVEPGREVENETDEDNHTEMDLPQLNNDTAEMPQGTIREEAVPSHPSDFKVPLRQSTRERRPPSMFTYPSLGQPTFLSSSHSKCRQSTANVLDLPYQSMSIHPTFPTTLHQSISIPTCHTPHPLFLNSY